MPPPSADVSTPETVHLPRKSACTDTSAPAAKKGSMERILVQREVDLMHDHQPRYLRYNSWHEGAPFLPCTADWTLHAPPISPPPFHELENTVATKTISENPHLFKIVMSINVDCFEELLKTHPNCPFVDSICRGLREGFWPAGADTHIGIYPDTHDDSLPTPSDHRKATFLQEQCDTEVKKDRFSPAFGTTLLPGMYCMPMHAVPKPNSDDLRLITDHSFGPYSLNSMIPRNTHATYPLDNLHLFGQILLASCRTGNIVVFKSDIAEAYRLMPMHLFWQIKQGVHMNGQLHIDHCGIFGGHQSGNFWMSFNGLATWIAQEIKDIPDLQVYSDDSYGINPVDELGLYVSYSKLMPTKQFQLLSFWDEINLPHKKRKQLFGPILPIIGIEVDPNRLIYMLPLPAQKDLIDELIKFCWHQTNKGGRRTGSSCYPLKQWQCLAGWLNWSLNVFPLLRPGLCNLYQKIRHKTEPNNLIFVNNAVRKDLTWMAEHMSRSSRIHIVWSLTWKIRDADIVIFCDACLSGMGFWYPNLNSAFSQQRP